MSLTSAETEAFAAIVRYLRRAERRRDALLVGLAALSTITAFSLLVLSSGWGWWPVAGFTSTFLPGIVGSYLVFRRRALSVARDAGRQAP